jgi:hypothetical protein
MKDVKAHQLYAGATVLVTGTCGLFPWAGVDGVVLPFLATAYDEHDEAEEEHEEAPGEVKIDAHRFFVDVGAAASEESVDAHETADEEEDQAEGDANV